ncbi:MULTISPECIES: PepSY domain-containing protein [unclassified Methylobacterium]|uniref:PepSY domain-containing protein n=1 Tax=unclassified Methylobacterium TaxID=2615210 RepID=UPI0036FF5360
MFARPLAAAALGLALLAGPALADQKLPPEQQTQVEDILKKEGFTKWKEIELDDGMIEVDDAIDANGKQFDLKLDPKTMEIVKRKAE